MKNKIIYLIKHNSIIQKLYCFFGSLMIKFCGLFVRINKKTILFVSYMGKKYNDSPKVIYDYIKSEKKYENYNLVWAFENPELFDNVKSVKIDSFKYFITALKAAYWVTNTNIERGLKFKKRKTKYLNTLHGIPIKTCGNDCPGRKDYDFSNVNYLCVSGPYDKKIFISAFNAKESSYIHCGMPRNDELWEKKGNEALVSKIREKLGIPNGKKIILFAPTWRESTDKGKTYSINIPIDISKWNKNILDKYVLLFRAHHITTNVDNNFFDENIIDVSKYDNVNELMLIADLLISDYSSILFDYIILEKPFFLYAYDVESYLNSRGTYIDIMQEFPYQVCLNEDELLKKIIANKEQNITEIKNKYINCKGDATKYCVRKLLEE